jgi:hypothetical protein
VKDDTIVVTNLLCCHQFPTPLSQPLKEEESYLDRLSNNARDLWNTKLPLVRFLDFHFEKDKVPVFITDPVGNDNVRQLSHHSLGSRVHEVERSAIIRLFEGVFVGESTSVLAFEGMGTRAGDKLVKTAAVDTDYNPRVWEQKVRLLKGLYVFVPGNCEHKVILVW